MVERGRDDSRPSVEPAYSRPGQLVVPVAAPYERPRRPNARDRGSRPRALVFAVPRRSAATVSPRQDRGGDPKALDLGERSGSVWIGQRPQRRICRNGGPATPRLHLTLGEVDVETSDLDFGGHLGQQVQVRLQGPDHPAVPRCPLAFEVPGRDPHVPSLAQQRALEGRISPFSRRPRSTAAAAATTRSQSNRRSSATARLDRRASRA